MAESSGAEIHLDVEEDPFANFGMEEEWLQLDDTAVDSELSPAIVVHISVCTCITVENAVHNKYLITWFSGQYGETLHSCAVFPLAFGSGKILVHTRAISRHIAH